MDPIEGTPSRATLPPWIRGHGRSAEPAAGGSPRRLYGEPGDFIAVIGNIGAARVLPGLARPLGRHVRTRVLPVPDEGRALPDGRLSDHIPFWDAGYDAVMVTLDLPFLAAVTEGLQHMDDTPPEHLKGVR